MPPKGRPPKKKRNISGLRNQRPPSPLLLSEFGPVLESKEPLHHADRAQPELDQEIREHHEPKDKVSSEQEDDEDGEASGFESGHSERKGLTNTELAKRPVRLSCRNDAELRLDDADWIPTNKQKKPKRGK